METPSVDRASWIARFFGGADHASLPAEDLADLAAELREDCYPAGTPLFRVGEAPTRVHIILSGAVELSCVLKGRQIVLQILRSGDVVGDVPLFLRMTEPCDAVALQDSRILSIDSLTRLLERRPRLAWRWMLSVSTRLADTQARLVELLAGGLEAQIALVLVRQAEHGVVHLRQSVLAELVGGRRPSVNRILKGLEAQGLLQLRYGQIEILDEAGLAAVAGLNGQRSRPKQASGSRHL
jgi:CRP/FNR family transcriptional regulator, cAMP and macrophage regulator